MSIEQNKEFGIHIIDSKGTIHARNLPDQRMAKRFKKEIEIALQRMKEFLS